MQQRIKYVIYWNGTPPCVQTLENFFAIDELLVIMKRNKFLFDNPLKHTSIQYEVIDHVDELQSFRTVITSCDVFLFTGWNVLLINDICKERMRINRNNKNVCLVDNIFKGPRQIVNIVFSRIFPRQFISHYIVPGIASRNYLRLLGVKNQRIYLGQYSVPKHFHQRRNTASKSGVRNSFVFVGQLINRKRVIELCDGYRLYQKQGGKSALILVGTGELEKLIYEKYPEIQLIGFKQSNELPDIFSKCHTLVLLSKEEHWGIVVAEAAVSGLKLLLSNVVGSGPDLLRPGQNGYFMEKFDQASVAQNLRMVEELKIDRDLISDAGEKYNGSLLNNAIQEIAATK